MLTETRINSKCPKCGHKCDAASTGFECDGDTNIKSDSPPKPGDISMCIECGEFSEFGPELQLQEMTAARKETLMKDPQIQLLHFAYLQSKFAGIGNNVGHC